MQVRQVIAAADAERQQVRKVRASQGRMPDNVRWRRLPDQCNRNKPPWLAMVRVERQCKRLPPSW